MIKFSNKRKKQSGITLLESLISTAIIGIGFVAIFQMVNFSVQSIDSSSERTKANYLVSMIAEDIIAHKITDLSWKAYVGKDVEVCGKEKDKLEAKDIKPIYETVVEDADENKKEKWNSIFNTNRYLKCKSEKDIKNVKIFQICKSGCTYPSKPADPAEAPLNELIHAEVYDEMHIGRIQINMNNGKKRKFLYFTADYKLK